MAARWRQDAAQSPRDLGGLLRLEKLAETSGDLPGQRESLEKIVALAPRDRDSRLKLARLLANLGERARAAAAYDALLAAQPGQLELLLARAELDIQAGDLDAGVKRLEDRAGSAPDDETVSVPILEFFLAHHLDAPAERLLRRSAGQHPEAVEPQIALAKFYLAHRRTGEARTLLDGLAARAVTDGARAESWQRAATVYRDADLPEDALRAWLQVETLLPANAPAKLATAELLLAEGEREAAAGKLERACELLPAGPEGEAAEHRLFEVLSSQQGKPTPRPDLAPAAVDFRRRFALRLTPGAAASPLARHLDKLEVAAGQDPTPANRLRLARWLKWIHADSEGVETLGKILADDPANVPARRELAARATEAKQYNDADRHLRELLRLDPDQRTAYLRQLASLRVETGDLDAALSAYGELALAQPGSAEVLSDLALVQQRADRWLDALETWKTRLCAPGALARATYKHPCVRSWRRMNT